LPLRLETDLRDYYCNYPLPIAQKIAWGSMIAGRGCGRGCIFCSPFDRITFSKKVRPRSLDSVFTEATALVDAGANVISFEDDDPTFDRERTLALALGLSQLRAKYICHSRLDELDDELIRVLGNSGCAMLKLGVESGGEKIVNRLNKGDGASWFQKAVNVTKMAKQNGISTCGLFILGSPDEGEDDLEKTRQLVAQASFDLIQLHYFTPYPGSPIHAQVARRTSKEMVAGFQHYDPKTPKQISFSNVSPGRLADWAKKILRTFVFRPSYAFSHLFRFGGFYLHNPDVFLRLLKGFFRLSSQG
jgi:radical SAM superfamily enzyme YgiQ (UPF0313 family)